MTHDERLTRCCAEQKGGFRIGEEVECRDADQEWERGIVTRLEPLEVQPCGWEKGRWDEFGLYSWDEVRARRPHARSPAPPIARATRPQAAGRACR